jgi:hypothetical protein
VPPAVRAAAFRALSEMPGVASTGLTHDRLGRPGVGIRIDEGRGFIKANTALGDQGGRLVGPLKPRKVTRILIVDPATSQILSDQRRAGSIAGPRTLIETDGWTNEKPHVPARLP